MKKIAVLLGGSSPEREISLRSGAAVLKSLPHLGYEAISFDPSKHPLQELASVDGVFNCLHGGAGENGQIQAFLELYHIPYTGSKYLACAISMQKHLCKLIWSELGLPVIAGGYFDISTTSIGDIESQVSTKFHFPLAVKPSNGGSSIGVSKVDDISQLGKALELASSYDRFVVVEEWISGEEYSVGIVANRTLPSIRITPHTKDKWYDHEAKYYTANTELATSYDLDTLSSTLEQKIQDISQKAFVSIGGENWGRIDLIKRNDELFLLEANFSPGLTETSLVSKEAAKIGWDFDTLIKAILDDIKK